MKLRRFGRTGWEVSEIGYGMWGMAGWTNSNDDESLQSLQAAVDQGCNFFRKLQESRLKAELDLLDQQVAAAQRPVEAWQQSKAMKG